MVASGEKVNEMNEFVASFEIGVVVASDMRHQKRKQCEDESERK